MNVIDITLPIYNSMWCYRAEWANHITDIINTNKGDTGTVHRYNLCSNTGTYIETSKHKLDNNVLLENFNLLSFYHDCKVLSIHKLVNNIVSLQAVEEELERTNLVIEPGDYVIIASGYGKNHQKEDYLTNSPSFEERLTSWIINKNISLIGTDTPIIENKTKPYEPVQKMFSANPAMLLLAPLNMDLNTIVTGNYLLNCLPLPIAGSAVAHCRAVLIKH